MDLGSNLEKTVKPGDLLKSKAMVALYVCPVFSFHDIQADKVVAVFEQPEFCMVVGSVSSPSDMLCVLTKHGMGWTWEWDWVRL